MSQTLDRVEEYVSYIRYPCRRRVCFIGGVPGEVVDVRVGNNSRKHVSIAEPIDLARWLSVKAWYVRLPGMRRRSSSVPNSANSSVSS